MTHLCMSYRKPKCKECKKELLAGELREHWEVYHLEKLQQIDKWLGKVEGKVKEWERTVRRQEGLEEEKLAVPRENKPGRRL